MIEIRHAKWECKKDIENQSLWDHLYVKISTVLLLIIFLQKYMIIK